MKKAATLKLARIVAEEVQRARENIRLPGFPRPYFVSQLVRDEEIWDVRAKYGTIHAENHFRRRDCLADVRVGSYRYDQVQDGGLEDNDKDDESYEYVRIPIGNDVDGVRHGLWRLTEAKFREAVEAYLTKKSHEVTYQNRNRKLQAFQKREPYVDLTWRKLPEPDMDFWRSYVKRASAVFKRCPLLKNGHVDFHARNAIRIFGDSEGTQWIESRPYWTLELYFWYLSETGDAHPYNYSYFVSDPDELPSFKECSARIRDTYAKLEELAKAPKLHSFSGPVLLDPIPAGLLIHEAMGHRLEASRLLSTGEGQTFRDRVNQPVLPSYLSLRDDPRLEDFEGQSLVGHYRHDDEGTPAGNAELIRDGVLKEFLTSRTPTGPKHKSNGHGRSRCHERTISRMGVTIVEARDGLDDDALRERFLEEIRRQGVPFGIRILEASGGETATEAYDFQAFLGEVEIAARVYPDGREEIIRGVDFVGTPLNAIRNIVAAGSRREVDNAYCGAESGFVPVSTISPSLLLSELELQSKSETPYTQYVYPMPWQQ